MSISKEAGDKAGEKATLSSMAGLYLNLRQYPEALKFYKQALSIAQELGDKAEEGATLNNIGLVYNNQGEYAQALQSYQQALAIRQAIGDKAGEGATLNRIGLVYDNQGRFSQALQSYQQALAIRQAIGDKAGEGTTLNNIGAIYQKQGQYPQALRLFEQSWSIYKTLNYKAGEGTSLNNIGEVYISLGQYPQALKFYEQALDIYRAVGDKAGEGTILSNIGSVYSYLEQYSQAIKAYEQALVISKEAGTKAGEGTILNNLGEVYLNLKQYPEALKFHEQALTIRQQVGDRRGEGVSLNNIGSVYSSLERYPEALKFFEQALVVLREIGDRPTEAKVLNNIGAVYNSTRQYQDAEKTLLTAVKILESLRPGLTDAAKIAIFEIQATTYRYLQESLVAQNKTNNALEIAERGRARAFVELLANRLSKTPTNQPIIEPPTSQQIQQIAKVQKATLVEYSLIGQNLYVWVVKPTGEVVFKQVNIKSLNTSLEDFVTRSRESIGIRGRGLGVSERVDAPSQAKQLQQLHKLLIEPIAQFLPTDPNSRVIFIPQASLFLVPFAALQDESGKYLIEKHTILTAPAIQVLELTNKQRQQVSGKDVLVVGNPTMPKIGEPPTELPSLPGAEREAQAIASLLKTKALTGNLASKSAILQQLTQSRIVHLATHGLLDDFKGQGVPGAIALAPSGNDSGLLTSSEILDLKLNAELVVLSACDTGRGRITGDGVIGLSRSLITAGVPSVIVSLWSVPDAPTASLMTEFYSQMQQNSDKAQSLRSAMLTTMKQHPDPKDWAVFTLIGEP